MGEWVGGAVVVVTVWFRVTVVPSPSPPPGFLVELDKIATSHAKQKDAKVSNVGGRPAAALMGCEGGVTFVEIRFPSYSLDSRRTVRFTSGWTCSNWRVLLEAVLLH